MLGIVEERLLCSGSEGHMQLLPNQCTSQEHWHDLPGCYHHSATVKSTTESKLHSIRKQVHGLCNATDFSCAFCAAACSHYAQQASFPGSL